MIGVSGSASVPRIPRVLHLAALLLLAAAPAVAAPAAAPAAVPPSPRAPWEARLQPCRLPKVEGKAFCGSYEVFENRRAKSGRKISLRIVLLPARGRQTAADPVFFLSGGPGEAATDGVVGFQHSPLRERRDLVLVDVRGTGGSNPLTCKVWGDGTRLDHIFPLDAAIACRDGLVKKADLTQYTTPAAMDDLEDVRRYLGFDKINLVGGSYGTFASQVFLARHPDSVRSIVLSGVVKPGDPSPLNHARNSQRALELLARDCAGDKACAAAFPRFQQEFHEVLDRLARQPARVAITNPATDKPATVVLTRSAAAEILRFALYSQQAGQVPLLVHQAAGGNYRELATAAVADRQELQDELAMGVLFSVTCAEDLPRIDPREIPAATQNTFYGDDRVREQLAVCAIWPHAPMPPGLDHLPPSPVPALLFSGERDPVTPPADAAQVAHRFPNGLWLEIPGGTHNHDGDRCEERLIAQFIDQGTTQHLDTACIRVPRHQVFDTK